MTAIEIKDYVSDAQKGDTAGNDARIAAAIAAASAGDKVLVAAPYTIHHQTTQILPGDIEFFGYGVTKSTFMMENYLAPSFQIGDDSSDPNSNADGSIRDIGFWRPLMPAFSRTTGTAGFTPILRAKGGVGRFRLYRMHMRNFGVGLQMDLGTDGRAPFDFDMDRLYGSGFGSMIRCRKAFGHTIARSNHNGGWVGYAGDNTHGYFEDSALVELFGEADGFEIVNRSNGNMNGRGLLWAYGSENITGVLIQHCWYDKVSKAGVHIHMDGGKFTDFEFNYKAWGGGPSDNVPGTPPALMLESTSLDDIYYGEVSELRGQNVRGPLLFCADRSNNGNGGAGRIREVDFLECASRNGSQGYAAGLPYRAPMFEMGGCAGYKNSWGDNHCNIGSTAHAALIGNQGSFDLADLGGNRSY